MNDKIERYEPLEDEYCKGCGNHEENCTCEQCAVCKKFFPLHKLYDFNTLAVCENCQNILEQRTTAEKR